MCGIIGIVGKEQVADRLVDGLQPDGIPGLCTAPASALSRAASWCAAARRASSRPRAGTRAQSRIRPHRHRPHPLGNARRAEHEQRAPARDGVSRARAQRDHRELQAAARCADRARPRASRARPTPKSWRTSSSEQVEAGLSPQDAAQGRAARRCAVPSRSPSPFRSHDDMLIGARLGSPLVVGYGDDEDLSRLRCAGARAADAAHHLPRGGRLGRRSPAKARRSSMRNNAPVTRPIVASGATRGRDRRRASSATSCRRKSSSSRPWWRRPCAADLRRIDQTVALPQIDFDAVAASSRRDDRRLRHQLLCRAWSRSTGSSSSRGCLVDIDVASEFRYRDPVLGARRPRALFISQSGETADTLAALQASQGGRADHRGRRSTCRQARWRARRTCCCPPTPGRKSALPRTKAFTCQLAVLAALAAHLAVKRGGSPATEEAEIVGHLAETPAALNAALAHDDEIASDGAPHRPGARRALSRARRGLSAGA